MNLKQKIIGILLAVVALLGGGYTASNLGGTAGVPGTVATSSFQTTVAATPRILFATSTTCSARIISTQATSIMLTFSDVTGQRPTGNNGHVQTASTTVAYPAENYGCGAVWVYPYGANVLTLTETR